MTLLNHQISKKNYLPGNRTLVMPWIYFPKCMRVHPDAMPTVTRPQGQTGGQKNRTRTFHMPGYLCPSKEG